MNSCQFYYIRSRDNLPIQATGIERNWQELQNEFNLTVGGYPGAVYYKTISTEGPKLFAVVNKKWVLYHEDNKWHRYITACDLKFNVINDSTVNDKKQYGEQDEQSWIVVSEKDYTIDQ